MSNKIPNHCFGTASIFGSFVNLTKYKKGWSCIPEEYRTEKNFYVFCYMNYLKFDAVVMFLEKIKEIESYE